MTKEQVLRLILIAAICANGIVLLAAAIVDMAATGAVGTAGSRTAISAIVVGIILLVALRVASRKR